MVGVACNLVSEFLHAFHTKKKTKHHCKTTRYMLCRQALTQAVLLYALLWLYCSCMSCIVMLKLSCACLAAGCPSSPGTLCWCPSMDFVLERGISHRVRANQGCSRVQAVAGFLISKPLGKSCVSLRDAAELSLKRAFCRLGPSVNEWGEKIVPLVSADYLLRAVPAGQEHKA